MFTLTLEFVCPLLNLRCIYSVLLSNLRHRKGNKWINLTIEFTQHKQLIRETQVYEYLSITLDYNYEQRFNSKFMKMN